MLSSYNILILLSRQRHHEAGVFRTSEGQSGVLRLIQLAI